MDNIAELDAGTLVELPPVLAGGGAKDETLRLLVIGRPRRAVAGFRRPGSGGDQSG
jgi:hypothetical protein